MHVLIILTYKSILKLRELLIRAIKWLECNLIFTKHEKVQTNNKKITVTGPKAQKLHIY